MVDHAVDLLGCGDALLATATLTLAAGGDLMAAAYIGNAAAAVEASMLGNQPVDAARLHAWFKDRHELIVEATRTKTDIVPTSTRPATATELIDS